LAPTCRSCLRLVDAWFPTTEAPRGVELLASVVADTVETFGSAHITGVPGEHLESVRRSTRKHLRRRGFRSQTYVVNAVVHVMSDDAYQAIDPALSKGWIDEGSRGCRWCWVPSQTPNGGTISVCAVPIAKRLARGAG
jgi:hypothetical protein